MFALPARRGIGILGEADVADVADVADGVDVRSMNQSYVFNGDADGLCALQQLRLAGTGGSGRRNAR